MSTSAGMNRLYKAVRIYSVAFSLRLRVSLSLGSIIMALVSYSGTAHLLLHNLSVPLLHSHWTLSFSSRALHCNWQRLASGWWWIIGWEKSVVHMRLAKVWTLAGLEHSALPTQSLCREWSCACITYSLKDRWYKMYTFFFLIKNGLLPNYV